VEWRPMRMPRSLRMAVLRVANSRVNCGPPRPPARRHGSLPPRLRHQTTPDLFEAIDVLGDVILGHEVLVH